MPVLVNSQSGLAEDLPQQEADAALSQGSHQIPLYDPKGNAVSVPLEQAHDAISQGFAQPSPDQLAGLLKHAKLNSTPELAKAALEKAAESGTFGLSTGAERVLGAKPEDIRARAENLEQEHPALNLGATAAGLAASSLVPFGEGALLGKAGEAVKGLTGLGGEGAGLLSNMAARAAGMSPEFALMQAGDETSRLISEDPNQSAETAIAHIGLSGLLGAGAGAALGAVSPLWSKAVGSKTGQFIEDFKNRMDYHIKNPSLASATTDELGNYYNAMKQGADTVYGGSGIKAQAIQKFLPEMSDKISAQAEGLNQKLEASLQDLKDDPFVGKLQRAAEKYQEAVTADGAGPSEYFDAAQDLKQQLQEWGKFHKDMVPLAEKEFRQTAKGLSHDVRTALEDSEVWGKSADVQKTINSAFKDYLPALDDFEKKFTSYVGNDRVIDPGKVNTYMNQLGKPNAEIKQEMLRNFLDASEKYKKVIEGTHADLDLKTPFQPTGLAHAKASLEEITPGSRVADTLVKRGLSRLGGEALGAGVGAGVGHLFGAGGMGALVGEHALGPFFGSVLPGIVRPLLEKASSSEGFKSAVDMGVAVTKGESMLNKATKAVFSGTTPAFSQTALAGERDREKLKKKLDEMGADPGSMMDVGGHIGHYLPDHGTALSASAMRAVQYLNSLKPNEDKLGPLDPPRVPPKSEIAAYDRAIDIAQNPVSVLNEVRGGTLTPQDLVTFATLYPSLHARVSQKLMAEMTAHVARGSTVPYRSRMSLALLMGQPLDATLTPAAIQSAQMHIQPVMQPQSQQKPQRKPSQASMNSLLKTSSLLQTGTQVSESRRTLK